MGAADFTFLPAIDLLDGELVRLTEGAYDRVTRYGAEPLSVAAGFKEQGAEWLHVVDLDAARSGRRENRALIRRLCRESGLKVEVGGGVRGLAQIEELLDDGAARVILGTMALEDEAAAAEAFRRWPEQIVLGLDARDGEVRGHGWTRGSGVETLAFARQMTELGCRLIIYTNISRDGRLNGPDLEMAARIQEDCGVGVIASGGVRGLGDVLAARDAGLAGIIAGKSLYEGRLAVGAAFAGMKSKAIAGREEALAMWQQLRPDRSGLIPVIAVSTRDKDVLMQAYMDEEAFVRTMGSGLMHYHSRSRDTLWLKGETSGNVQVATGARVDCDEDCLLFLVTEAGSACHTGERSCFYRDVKQLIDSKGNECIEDE